LNQLTSIKYQLSKKETQQTKKLMCREPTFFLYRAENGIGDESAEEHLKNPKTSRGS
jgi:hypothetical protein